MKYFTPAVILTVIYLSDYVDSKVILRHPDLLTHYLELRNNSAGFKDRRLTFAKRGRGFVCRLCLQLLRMDTFQLLEMDESMPDPPLPLQNDFTSDDIRELFSINRYVKMIRITIRGINIVVLQCAELKTKSLYIENGRDINEYFAFTMFNDSEKPVLIEVAIYHPNIHWNTLPAGLELSARATWEEEDLKYVLHREQLWLKGQERGENPRKDITTVKGIDRFKLCATVAYSCMGLAHNTSPNLYSIRSAEETHKTNVKVLFVDPALDAAFEPPDYHHPVDLIPCAINREWDQPDFYVAADQQQDDAVFVFHKVEREGHPEAFVVVKRLYTVVALKDFFWDDYDE